MDRLRNQKVIKWLKSKANGEYSNYIDIMWIYGSHANGTENIFSDVDVYYIQKSGSNIPKKKSFMIEDVGYSIESQSWSDVEDLADLKQMFLPCIGVTQIIYARTTDEEEKFKSLVNRMNENLSDNQICYSKACQKFSEANELYAKMLGNQDLTRVRFLAGQIIMFLAYSVALCNNTFFHKGLKKQYEDLKEMKKKPDSFTELYIEIIKAKDVYHIKKLCGEILKNTQKYLELDEPVNNEPIVDYRNIVSHAPNYTEMASEYEEYSSIFNKVYYNTVDNNYIVTFLSAVYLQRLLDETCLRNGLPMYSILDKFEYDNLPKIRNETRKVQLDFRRRILDGNGKINEFKNFDEFIEHEKRKKKIVEKEDNKGDR